jgi:hypothetical protein
MPQFGEENGWLYVIEELLYSSVCLHSTVLKMPVKSKVYPNVTGLVVLSLVLSLNP